MGAIIMCATIVGMGLFFLILDQTKVGKKFFDAGESV
jgi:hypothetical protein